MNLAACGTLPTQRISATWFRAISLTYVSVPLAVEHSRATTSRFSPGFQLREPDQFTLLYMAQDPVTAMFETGAMVGEAYVPGKAFPHPLITSVMLNVLVDLQHVVDLTSDQRLKQIDATAQEMTGDWKGYKYRNSGLTAVAGSTGLAPTQELGWELKKSGHEGFLAISSKISTNRNLIVFPENLRTGSSVEFQPPDKSIVPYRIEGTL